MKLENIQLRLMLVFLFKNIQLASSFHFHLWSWFLFVCLFWNGRVCIWRPIQWWLHQIYYVCVFWNYLYFSATAQSRIYTHFKCVRRMCECALRASAYMVFVIFVFIFDDSFFFAASLRYKAQNPNNSHTDINDSRALSISSLHPGINKIGTAYTYRCV